MSVRSWTAGELLVYFKSNVSEEQRVGGGRAHIRSKRIVHSPEVLGLRAVAELMATGVVGKGAADKHGIQKLAATPDFRERRWREEHWPWRRSPRQVSSARSDGARR